MTRILLLALLAGCTGKGASPDDTADTGGDSDTGGDTDSGGDTDVDADGDGVPASEDCDDDDATVAPGLAELCDGVDQDCDGETDEGVKVAAFTDADGDGHGDPAAPVEACPGDAGTVAVGDDCGLHVTRGRTAPRAWV